MQDEPAHACKQICMQFMATLSTFDHRERNYLEFAGKENFQLYLAELG